MLEHHYWIGLSDQYMKSAKDHYIFLKCLLKQVPQTPQNINPLHRVDFFLYKGEKLEEDFNHQTIWSVNEKTT